MSYIGGTCQCFVRVIVFCTVSLVWKWNDRLQCNAVIQLVTENVYFHFYCKNGMKIPASTTSTLKAL
jgi:hypothetical protein